MITALARLGMSFMRAISPSQIRQLSAAVARRCRRSGINGPPMRRGLRPTRSASGLFDRNFLVDQAEVDTLPAPHEPRDHEDYDRQRVHREHVVLGVPVVDTVGAVREPLV